jgi:hypothetical protein
MTSFDEACAIVATALAPVARGELARRSLTDVRAAMRTHAWAPFAPVFDARGRGEGFHALHDWDGQADAVNPEIIPVDVLDWLARVAPAAGTDHAVRLLLIDYYFLHVLSLLSLRIWDGGDADANLERLDTLLHALQGPGGSGHLFVDNAATLLLLATAHFEMEERGYHTLLEKVRGLNADHRACVALDHAGSLGCHLRFGFEASYVRDVTLMRGDNAADYPWLAFALETLLDEYAARPDPRTAEGILNGLSPDALAFGRHAWFAERLAAVRPRLIDVFETLGPDPRRYSPLALFFNFSHNIVKGALIDALLTGSPWDVTLNDLLTALPAEEEAGPRQSLAVRLMGYARHHPSRIAGRLTPAIVYDPQAGRQAYRITLRKLREMQ